MAIDIGGGINIGPGITIAMPPATTGSVLFSTSPTQYLTVPNNAAFTQNQAFTIETWFRPTNITGG